MRYWQRIKIKEMAKLVNHIKGHKRSAELRRKSSREKLGCNVLLLITVLLPVGLVLIFIITGFESMQVRARQSPVQSDMRIVQQWANDYADLHKGQYPIALDECLPSRQLSARAGKPMTQILVLRDTAGIIEKLKMYQIAYIPLDIKNNQAGNYLIFGKWKEGEALLRLPYN